MEKCRTVISLQASLSFASNLDNSNFQGSGNGDESKIVPKITDGFTIVALILAIIVLVISSYYYKKNKQELKSTFNLLKTK